MTEPNFFKRHQIAIITIIAVVVIFGSVFSFCFYRITSANTGFEQYITNNETKLKRIEQLFHQDAAPLNNSVTFTKRDDKDKKEYTLASPGWDLQNVMPKIFDFLKINQTASNSGVVMKNWPDCVKDIDFCISKKIGSWIRPGLRICQYKKLVNQFAKYESTVSGGSGIYIFFKDGKMSIADISNAKDEPKEYEMNDQSLLHIFIHRNTAEGITMKDLV